MKKIIATTIITIPIISWILFINPYICSELGAIPKDDYLFENFISQSDFSISYEEGDEIIIEKIRSIEGIDIGSCCEIDPYTENFKTIEKLKHSPLSFILRGRVYLIRYKFNWESPLGVSKLFLGEQWANSCGIWKT